MRVGPPNKTGFFRAASYVVPSDGMLTPVGAPSPCIARVEFSLSNTAVSVRCTLFILLANANRAACCACCLSIAGSCDKTPLLSSSMKDH